MYIVHVFVHVKPEYIDDFKAATIENARNSLKEPGVARFDVIQNLEDPSQFVLVEVYRTPDDPARHKNTMHYSIWSKAVMHMMADPRSSLKFQNVYPDENGWD